MRANLREGAAAISIATAAEKRLAIVQAAPLSLTKAVPRWQRKIRLREKLGGRGDGMAGPRGRVFEGAAPVTATEKETSSRFVTPCACLITKYFENAKKGRRVGFSAVSSSLSLPPCRRVVCAVLIRCRWFSSKKLQTLFLESLCALTTFENIRLLLYTVRSGTFGKDGGVRVEQYAGDPGVLGIIRTTTYHSTFYYDSWSEDDDL